MALACDQTIAILSTELDGKLLVAYCNIGCLPPRTQQFLGDAPDHSEFQSVANGTQGIPCVRNGTDAVLLSSGKLCHRFVNSVMWARIRNSHILYAEKKTFTLWRYLLLNFHSGSVLPHDRLMHIDRRTCGIRRTGSHDAQRILQIARSGIWLRAQTVRSRCAMLNNLEKSYCTQPTIEKYDRMLQFALGGTTDQLADVGTFIPCKVQTERLQIGVSEFGGDRIDMISWSLTPCACDVRPQSDILKRRLSDLTCLKGGVYPHDRISRLHKKRRKERNFTKYT